MPRISLQIDRFARALYIKGAVMLFLGLAALRWPDPFLVNAMMIASLLLATSGLYEILLAGSARHVMRGWPIALLDGAACLGLAALSVTLTVIPLRTTLLLTALWLLLYAGFAGGLALALWPMARTRGALLAMTATNLVLAAVAAFDRHATIYVLLYVGAVYAIAFGTFQAAAGMWIHRVAVPEFAPTVQASWRSPHAT